MKILKRPLPAHIETGRLGGRDLLFCPEIDRMRNLIRRMLMAVLILRIKGEEDASTAIATDS